MDSLASDIYEAIKGPTREWIDAGDDRPATPLVNLLRDALEPVIRARIATAQQADTPPDPIHAAAKSLAAHLQAQYRSRLRGEILANPHRQIKGSPAVTFDVHANHGALYISGVPDDLRDVMPQSWCMGEGQPKYQVLVIGGGL